MAVRSLKSVAALFTHVPASRSENSHSAIDRDYCGQAIVSETIYPEHLGRIQFQGSWWSAWCEQDVVLTPGKVVQVIGRRNITLLVQPV